MGGEVKVGWSVSGSNVKVTEDERNYIVGGFVWRIYVVKERVNVAQLYKTDILVERLYSLTCRTRERT